MDLWGSILALVASQHGVVALRQVAELGVDRTTFRRRALREGWVEHDGACWSPPAVELDDRGRAMLAALRGGDQCAVTGRAALHLRGLPVAMPDVIRVVTPMQRHAVRRAEGLRVIASRTLREGDVEPERRIPATTIARSFLDLVMPPTPSVADVRDLLLTVEQARSGALTKIQGRAADARGVPGRPVLLRALDDVRTVDADSPFSDRVLRRLLRAGMQPDPLPVSVPTPGRVLHPDITWAAKCVGIECDGLGFHGSHRDVAIDARKDRRYLEVGWTCFRIGWYEFHNGWNGFLRDLKRVLG